MNGCSTHMISYDHPIIICIASRPEPDTSSKGMIYYFEMRWARTCGGELPTPFATLVLSHLAPHDSRSDRALKTFHAAVPTGGVSSLDVRNRHWWNRWSCWKGPRKSPNWRAVTSFIDCSRNQCFTWGFRRLCHELINGLVRVVHVWKDKQVGWRLFPQLRLWHLTSFASPFYK